MLYWCLTSASKPLICRESWCRLSVEAVVLQHTLKLMSLCAKGMLVGGGGGGVGGGGGWGWGGVRWGGGAVMGGVRARGKGTMLLVLHFSTLTEHTLYKARFLAQQDIIIHTPCHIVPVPSENCHYTPSFVRHPF